jgi:transposase
MRHFSFTEEDVQCFQVDRFNHPDPRVQRKMEVLWLKSKRLTHDDIAQFAGVSRRSVQRYLDEYLHGGIEELQTVSWHEPQSELAEHRTTLAKYFEEHPPRSTAEAQAVIEEQTGIRRGLTQVRRFLKKISACGIVK